MRLLWWVLFLGSIGSLAYAVAVRRDFQRRRVPLPEYLVGNVWGGLSMVLLVVSYPLGLDSAAGRATLYGSLAFLLLAIGQSIQASRRRL